MIRYEKQTWWIINDGLKTQFLSTNMLEYHLIISHEHDNSINEPVWCKKKNKRKFSGSQSGIPGPDPKCGWTNM